MRGEMEWEILLTDQVEQFLNHSTTPTATAIGS
jgi:hypothetical protein